jgi:hypothetical protein
MKKCKCVVLIPISNGSTTFKAGELVKVQFYKKREDCDVWGLDNKGPVTVVSINKVKKANEKGLYISQVKETILNLI